ncbi:I78 family peptidase inhibitor [Parvibaculum sp.]|jgi:predicted amidohydrolase|uniref:I78 family peptidase inhibitor n=1 Tax=Parvibaculum sp. TaxID=2024848 RepID=UPI0025DF2D43|nr:I78 family peptidase inhibitor [Parvibaculum sp.]|tara:strand:- start:11328 stop:11831 length:504 start_codon:yes stop_codon:yes gene_type:complete
MKYSVKHLLGSVAIAALVTVAACDQNEEEQAADTTPQEAPAVENAVPMTAEPGDAEPAMNGADNTMPRSEMPGGEMPADGETGISMDEEAAAGADTAAAAGCQAAADALGVWTGKAYSEAESEITAGENVATIRVIRPGEAVTEDFRPDRLNVELDEEENVSRVYCG